MILRKGDMWSVYDDADLFVITTNSSLTNDRRLVMGAGIAREARDRFPGLDVAMGACVYEYYGDLGKYGFITSPRWPRSKIAAFQVKRHWSGIAEIELIKVSAIKLQMWCACHPKAKVHLNFPGIGNGRLRREDVMKHIVTLPDSVSVWEYR